MDKKLQTAIERTISTQHGYYAETAAQDEMHANEGMGDYKNLCFVRAQSANRAMRLIVAPAEPCNASSWYHPLLTSPGVIVCALKETY